MAPLPQRVHSASTLQNNGTPAWKPSLAAIGAPAWKTRQPDPALWAVISEEWEAPAPSGWTGSFQKATPSGAWKPSLPARNVLTAANANVLDLEFHRQGRLEKNTSKADPDRDTAQCTGAEISKEQEATSAPRLVLRADDSWISDRSVQLSNANAPGTQVRRRWVPRSFLQRSKPAMSDSPNDQSALIVKAEGAAQQVEQRVRAATGLVTNRVRRQWRPKDSKHAPGYKSRSRQLTPVKKKNAERASLGTEGSSPEVFDLTADDLDDEEADFFPDRVSEVRIHVRIRPND